MEISGDLRLRYVVKLIKLEFINCVHFVLYCLEEVDCSLLICNPNLVLGLCLTYRPGFTVSRMEGVHVEISGDLRLGYVAKLEFINCVFILFCFVWKKWIVLC